MKKAEIESLLDRQKAFFDKGNTLEIRFRKEMLKKLYKAIEDNTEELQKALAEDLGKSGFESDMCEIRLTLSEISWMLRHIKKLARKKRAKTPLSQFCAKSYMKPVPYGNVLIMSPWNYPVLLTLEPLADAIAAGNTAILKPSAYSPAASSAIKRIISSIYPEDYVAVVQGGRTENSALLSEHFDYIFFTGSKTVGKTVMAAASEHLIPVTLELGGKSPCIVDETAKIPLAAKRIVFGKFLNCGQTCVAPDYVLCERSIQDKLIEAIKREIAKQFTSAPLENPDYGKIINEKHFDRILSLIDIDKTVYGGDSDRSTLKIEPTVMKNVTLSDAVMKEELFGPVLPIISYKTIEQAMHMIKSIASPLALYIFSENRKTIKRITSQIGFGGGCINDTIIHLATSEMGFGGFGESGMGSYHGKAGFDTFTHYKSIVDKATWIDLPLRYQKYNESYHKIIRFFLK